MKTFSYLMSGIACVAALGCQASAGVQPVGTATVTTAPVNNVPSERAVREITTERCNRQLSCDNVGQDRRWETLEACASDERRMTRDALVGAGCDTGVDATALGSCLAEIRNQRCEDAFSDTGLVACRSVRLCR